MDDELEKMRSRIEALEHRIDLLDQQLVVVAKLSKTMGDIESVVCGTSANAMDRESLIQMVKRIDSEVKELAPVKKVMYAMMMLSPIVYHLINAVVTKMTGGGN